MTTTRIITTMLGSDSEPISFDVALTFDEVIDRVSPLTPPSSALEYRSHCIYEPTNGTGRVFCPPQLIGHVIEQPQDE